MKKILSLLFTITLITIITFNTQAQDELQVKSYISLDGGVSRPMGNFAATDYSNNNAGFAKLGLSYSLKGARYIHKNWAIAGSLTYQDQGRPNANDLQNLSNGYNADFNGSTTTTTMTGRYQSITALVGPQYTFLYKSLFIDVGLSVGAIKSFATPYYTNDVVAYVGNTSNTTTTTFYQNTSTAGAFAYGAGIALRYAVSDHFGFLLSGNYLGTTGIDITNQDDTYPNGRRVTSQTVSAIQGRFGIYIAFH